MAVTRSNISWSSISIDKEPINVDFFGGDTLKLRIFSFLSVRGMGAESGDTLDMSLSSDDSPAPVVAEVITVVVACASAVVELVTVVAPAVVELVTVVTPAVVELVTVIAPAVVELVTVVTPAVVELVTVVAPAMVELVTVVAPAVVELVHVVASALAVAEVVKAVT